MRTTRIFSTSIVPLTLIFMILGGAGIGAPALDRQAVEAIDALMNRAYPPDGPGGSVLVVRGGEILYRKAFGMANLELDVALEADMVFRIGSITKQFTAAAIMRLEEQGKLSVSDPIEKYLEDYPTHGHTITIEHLLTHTSGIYSYTAIPEYFENDIRRDLTTEELIAVFKDLPMDFAPGTEFRYNNSGYVLLGAIIEKVSGQPYPEYVQENLFHRAGMKDSHYGGSQLIDRRVSGYSGSGGSYRNANFLSMTQPQAAGSLLSTVDDLAKWNAALTSGEIVKPDSYRRMTQPYTLTNGEVSPYGYGLSQAKLRGRDVIQHGGGINGFASMGLQLPGENLFVAVFSNYPENTTSPGLLAQLAAAIAIGDPYPTRTPVKLPVETLQRYSGVYQIDDSATRIVTVEDGKLLTRRTGGGQLEAIPSSETTFFYDTSLSYFVMQLDGAGNVTGMTMFQNGEGDGEFARLTDAEIPRMEAASIDPAIYDSYVGSYQVAPGFILTVRREGDRLMTQATGQPEIEIFPESETRFFLKVVDAQIEFVHDASGQVNELILFQAGREMSSKRVR